MVTWPWTKIPRVFHAFPEVITTKIFDDLAAFRATSHNRVCDCGLTADTGYIGPSRCVLPLRPAACCATTAPSQPRPLPTAASRQVQTPHSQPQQRRPYKVHTSIITDRLFYGLTAKDRWHRIYRWQQRSLSLGRRLMLAETVAQADASDFYI